jgi:L-ascorbate metabolism protein UlaG (beta-lactamase superfamily)
MRLSANTSVILRPAEPPVPFELLLSRWSGAGFEPGECRRALEQLMVERKIPGALFCPDEIERSGHPATDALLFDFFSPSREWIWLVQIGNQRAGVRLPVAAMPAVAQLLRAIGPSRDVDALLAAAEPGIYPKLLGLLCGRVEDASGPAPYGAWSPCAAPGIYRREHASVVVRSRTTTLLVDPQGVNLGQSSNLGRYPVEQAPLEVDAIVITHHHDDHWHLPSILYVAGDRGVPVIVPVVPRPNLLTGEDFTASLEQVGVPSRALAWWTTTRVGDIEIDALPFFGEQPTRGAPGPATGLRSWGNCYRFTTPEFSAMLLVDSGIDPMGSMIDVVTRSVAERGPPDVLLSNCRAFPEIINMGLPHYVHALPFERVRAAFLGRDRGFASMTLGERGVAEVCVAARARYFLPYAHMFEGLGVHADSSSLDGVQRGLDQLGATTRVIAWNPGDVARFDHGELVIEHAYVPPETG